MYTPSPVPIETKVAVLEEKLAAHEQMMSRIDTAIEKLSEVNSKVSKMLAVHEEKIGSNEKVDNILFAKIDQLGSKMDSDHNVVLSKIQELEKKVWIGIGVVSCVTFIISNTGFVEQLLTRPPEPSIIGTPRR
jgi:methionine synthase II (cobalamin-independent)